MISKATLATVFALVVRGVYAQCPTITSQVTYGATTSVTVSSATRATITDPAGNPQDITILSCAQATVGSSGTVNIDGGTATLSGTLDGTDIHRATANVIGPATIPTATYASISIYASQSLGLTSASDVSLELAPAATLSVQGDEIGVMANNDDIRLTYDARGGSVNLAGENAIGDITLLGVSNEDIFVRIHRNARALLRGEEYAALVYESAAVDVAGFHVTCTAVEDGSCFAAQDDATLVAGGNGYAEATQGTNNWVTVSFLGSGLVGGDGNTGTVSSGGTLTVINTGRANVGSGGVATIFPSVSAVTVSSAGTATMYAAATVTAEPGAFLSVTSPQTEIRSIGDSGTNTVFEARMAPTGGGDAERRRARRAQPTGVCGTGSSWCPNLRDILGCVDTRTDIFNCGGCALTSGAGRDCTQVYNGGVACVRGVCLEL